jgi:molybdate transport system substrate-binding protein
MARSIGCLSIANDRYGSMSGSISKARKAGASYDAARRLAGGESPRAAHWEGAMRFNPLAFIAQTALIILLLSQDITANAAEIKVLSTHAVLEVLSELGPQFERSTGHKLSFSYDPANIIKRQIEGGSAFDIAIVTRGVIDDLTKRSGLGVAVREGAPKPDISAVDGFKLALLSTKSLIRSTEGTSGIYFEKLLERLGIADEMRSKIRLGPSGRLAEFVARGEVEMAVQQVSELLPVQGSQFVGPFPPELQLYTIFSAGISPVSENREAAEAFIKSLTASTAVPLLKAKGLEPISR